MKGQLGNIAFSLLSDSLGELMLLVRVTQLISKHGSKQHSSSLEVSAAPPLGVSGRPYRQQGLEQPGRMNRAWDWNGWEEKREKALLCAAMSTSASILD